MTDERKEGKMRKEKTKKKKEKGKMKKTGIRLLKGENYIQFVSL